jgi:putative ABC transport system permease protein
VRRLPPLAPIAFVSAIVALAVFGWLAAAGAAEQPPKRRDDAIQDTRLPGVLLSRQLMAARRLQVGDTVRFATTPSGERAMAFRVVGVYEPTPDPMRFSQPSLEARLHLPDLLALTVPASDRDLPQAVSSINVSLADPTKADAFAREVSARLPGSVARSTSAPNDRTSTFLVIERFHLAVAIVTLLGSALFLLALMVMLVDERRETVGTLRLIGLTRGRLLRQVLAEGVFIAAAGTVFGLLFALATEGAFNRFFQWRYDTALVFLRVTPGVIVQSVLLAVPLGIAASVVASWTLLRREPLALVRR